MNELNNAAIIVCVCSIVCTILSMLIPFGRMNKIINLVLSLFLICSLIVPLASLFGTDFTFDMQSTNTYAKAVDKEEYNQLILNETAKNLVVAADDLLKNENINASNIEVSLKKTDTDSIYISQINIYISNEFKNRAEDIREIITINMSKEPVIILDE